MTKGDEKLYSCNCKFERNANFTRKTKISDFVFFLLYIIYMRAPKCIIEKLHSFTSAFSIAAIEK